MSRRPTRRPRELRYWDHATDGPVPESYWQARRKAVQVAEAHRAEIDRMIAWGVAAFVAALAVGTAVMALLGYGPR